MQSRLQVAGQAIHPILVMFPLGLFAIALIFDLAYLTGAPTIVGELAYWNLVAGLFSGVLAALAGAIDLMFVPDGTAQKRTGVLHGVFNMGVLVLFAVILMVRMGAPDRVAGGGLFLVELVALGGAGVGAWLGGALSERPAARARAGSGTRAFARPAAGHRIW